ncbi:isoprenoid biosynthesis-like protein [Armillaria nabsnona]|nr:isoprenoid biosynthesis-like protein [Armillaria nabsnona]
MIIRQELVDYIMGKGMLKDAIEWYKQVRNLHLNRGMFCHRHRRDHQGDPLMDNEYPKLPCLAGLSSSCFQAFFLVSNDMMDSLIRRRGQPCWYCISKVGQIIISDSFMLEAAICYRISAGELLCPLKFWSLSGDDVPDREGQLITAPEDEVYLSKFSLHSLIMIYKTAYYSFYLPVAYFQIQEDFFDFSGTPEQIGNIGMDIFDNKCSWCVNTMLPVCTPKQQWVLDENYGRKDSECERRVKVVFESPEVDFKWRKRNGVYEAKVPEIEGKGRLKTEIFKSFLDKIYKRTK